MKEIICRLNFKFSAEHGKISLLLQKPACCVLWSRVIKIENLKPYGKNYTIIKKKIHTTEKNMKTF
jgi:hypothetical protein